MFAPMKVFLLLRDEPCRAGVEESERLRPDGSTRLIHVRKATFSRHARQREGRGRDEWNQLRTGNSESDASLDLAHLCFCSLSLSFPYTASAWLRGSRHTR